MKRLLCGILAAVLLCLGTGPARAALEGFEPSKHYEPSCFADVAETDWFAENVRFVYEYGVMEGVSADRFDPRGTVTIAQAITIACRLHQSWHEAEDLSGGSPWYAPYLAYAQRHDLVGELSDEDMRRTALRADFAMILSRALREEDLAPINDLAEGELPDVCPLMTYSEPVTLLYRAGVLTGNDAYGSFTPYSTITRAEAAAIVSRMIDPALRKTLSLRAAPAPELVALEQIPNRKNLQKKATDEQFAEAYAIARSYVEPLARYSRAEQLYCVTVLLRQLFERGMEYSMESAHYNDPYGYFVEGSASCAGCTRATGLCLSILGIPFEHVNENQYSHQWCRVPVNKEYWIADAYGLYCGPEPAPYTHPYFE